MENVLTIQTTQKNDALNVKDIIQNYSIPNWFPDSVKEKLSGYVGPNKGRLIERIGKNLELGLDVIADEFNRPIFDKSAKLKTEKERTKLLSAVGIRRETLAEYTRTGGYQENPEEASVIHERAKKELVDQIWKVTSRAWENDRTRREKERASHDYSLPHKVNRSRHSLDRVFEKVGGWKQELLGVRNVNKMAERLLDVQPGVEDVLREYGVE